MNRAYLSVITTLVFIAGLTSITGCSDWIQISSREPRDLPSIMKNGSNSWNNCLVDSSRLAYAYTLWIRVVLL